MRAVSSIAKLSAAGGDRDQGQRKELVMGEDKKSIDRRAFLGDGLRTAGVMALVGSGGFLMGRSSEADELVWQLDPDKCVQCGNCATYCVLDVSAVKCVNCGYCDICTGYFEMNYTALDTAAENQMCPTGAIVRAFVEGRSGQRFYEYTIDEPLCIGCGKCVEGCALMNGSLYIQVQHHLCLNCNECAIAIACPTQAFYRVPAAQAEILKRKAILALEARVQRLRREAGDDPQTQREVAELLARIEQQTKWRAQQQRQETVGSTTTTKEDEEAS
jgi:electron transport complex protein RnfB